MYWQITLKVIFDFLLTDKFSTVSARQNLFNPPSVPLVEKIEKFTISLVGALFKEK